MVAESGRAKELAGLRFQTHIRKPEYFREGGSDKHLRDIRAMLHVSREEINFSELNEWVQRLGVEMEWRKVQASK